MDSTTPKEHQAITNDAVIIYRALVVEFDRREIFDADDDQLDRMARLAFRAARAFDAVEIADAIESGL